MEMTLAQKILARAAGKRNVRPGEYVVADIDLAMVHIAWGPIIPILAEAGIKKVWDPDKIVSLLDHYTPAPTIRDAESHKKIEEAVKFFGIKNYYGQWAGVCHQVLPEMGFVLPGQLVVGTDSHTTTYGAFGAASTGIGYSEMAYVLTTGKLWFKVPETIKFVLSGKMPAGVMSKDVILYIASKYSSSVAQYKAIEFAGETAAAMSLASRMTMSNMSMEIGAKFAFFAPDAKVSQYLSKRTDKKLDVLQPDLGAVYEQVHNVDVSWLEPQVAFPFAVDNVKGISQAGKIKIQQAVLGSCTNGRLEDFRAAAGILKGKKVHPDVRLLIEPASAEIYQDIIREGILSDLIDAGGIVCPAGCGTCFGAHMGLLAAGEACVASINRNFKGRMGSPDAKVYLASPATVAASALTGELTDPRNC